MFANITQSEFLVFQGWGVLCFVVGYYVAHRGLTGVKNDLVDIKNDILMVKTRLENNFNKQPVVVAQTPVS